MLTKILPVAVVCLLTVFAPSAQGTTSIQFALSDPSYTYTDPLQVNLDGSGELLIESQNMVSSLTVQTMDERSHSVLDSASLANFAAFGDFFRGDLAMTGGPGGWSASGTLTFTDADVSQPALAANFQSTQVWLSGNADAGYQFGITGVLTPQAGGTMLVNHGSPWVFTGNTAGGPPDGDGNPLTITGDGQPYYDSGTATFISNLTADDVGDISSLDELMQYSFYADGDSTGSAVGTATVPEPLTMIALTMSMGALGGYLRKRGGG